MTEFFVLGKGMTMADANSRAELITFAAYGLMAVGPFYKSLMDKIGRKPIFIINTGGMALGMLLCFFSPNFAVFALGQLVIGFFTMHDMQMIYVYEVAPAKWRSTIYFAFKVVGVLSTLFIPLLRDIYVTDAGTGWRNVFIIPAIVGFAIFLMSVFVMRESDVFLKSRISYLQTSEADRLKDKQENKRKSGIFPALKYIFKNGQLKWLAITIIVTCTATVITMQFDPFISQSFTKIFQAQGLDEAAVTAAVTKMNTDVIYYQPFSSAVVYALCALISDKIGRKKSIVVFSTLTFVGFVCFALFVSRGMSAAAVGIALGVYIGSFWNVTDLNGLMFAESAPTELRGSIMGAQGIFLGLGMGFSIVLNIVLMPLVGIVNAMLILGVPGLAAGAALAMIKLKETKGADLEKIEYEA